MSKVIKNTTLSDIDVFETGVTLLSSSSYIIPVEDYVEWSRPDTITEITNAVNTGDIVINDGVKDLNPTDGLNFLKHPDNAPNIRFENNDNNFSSDNVQDAIEEAKFQESSFNIVDSGIFRTSRLFSAYNSANSQLINTTASTVQINTPFPGSDNGSYLISSGEVEFLDEEESYKINYSVTFDNSDGSRTNTQTFLEKFNGSTWSKIIGSDVYTYERTSNADRQTGSTTLVVSFGKNEKVRVRSQTIQGSNNTTVAESCSITIEPSNKAAGIHNNLGLDCKTVIEKDDILSKWNCGEL